MTDQKVTRVIRRTTRRDQALKTTEEAEEHGVPVMVLFQPVSMHCLVSGPPANPALQTPEPAVLEVVAGKVALLTIWTGQGAGERPAAGKKKKKERKKE